MLHHRHIRLPIIIVFVFVLATLIAFPVTASFTTSQNPENPFVDWPTDPENISSNDSRISGSEWFEGGSDNPESDNTTDDPPWPGTLEANGIGPHEHPDPNWEDEFPAAPWHPPPYDSDLDIPEGRYIYLWSGLPENTDRNDQRSNNGITVSEFYLSFASAGDGEFDTASPIGESWNEHTHTSFGESDRDVSVRPNGVSLHDEGTIKSAYIDIAAVSPSTIVHRSENEEPVRYGSPTGELLITTDFRVEIPETTTREATPNSNTSRTRYSLNHARESDVTITANGEDVTGSTTDSRGASEISYQEVPDDSVDMMVEKEYEVEYTRTEEEYQCIEQNETNDRCEEESWVIVDQSEVTDSLTVTDNVSFEIPQEEPTIRVREGEDNESVYLQVTDVEVWTEMYVEGVGTISGPYDTYTQRNDQYDEIAVHTNDGFEGVHYSVFSPVETHAFPAREEVEINATGNHYDLGTISVTRTQSGREIEIPSYGFGINVDDVTETGPRTSGDEHYEPIESTTLHIVNITDEQIEYGETIGIRSAVYRTDLEGDVSIFPAPRDVVLSVSSTPIYETSSEEELEAMEVTVTLTDNETGRPINTGSRPEELYIGETKVNTDSNGVATLTVPADEYGLAIPIKFNATHSMTEPIIYENEQSSAPVSPHERGLFSVVMTFWNSFLLPLVTGMLSLLVCVFLIKIGLTGKISLRDLLS